MLSAWFAGEVTLLPFPYLRVGVLLAYGDSGVCGLRRRSRLPLVVRHLFPASVGPSPFLGLGVVWSQVCGPSCNSWFWTLLMLGCTVLTPSPLAAPSPFVAVDLPWAFARTWISRPRPCLGSSLLLVVLTFPCPGFSLGASGRWMVQAPALFLGLTLGSSLSLPVLAAGLRWLRFILSCPPSVASLQWLLPWFFVGYLLACPRGAAVPLDSWVLWCS